MIALDPGEKRSGLVCLSEHGLHAFTYKPWAAVRWFNGIADKMADEIDIVILEQWVPYPDAMNGNAWRDLIEAKILGAFEWICQLNEIPYTYQPTTILVPTTALADARGYQWVATNRDEKAAEAHLYHYRHLMKGKS